MATVNGTNNSDVIDEHDGVTNDFDIIYGLSGNDLIFGLGGNDIIKGGGGADSIYGGSGNDTAFYLDSLTGVVVNLTNGSGAGGTAAGDRLFSIENLVGSDQDDVLIGNEGANELVGFNGRDSLKGGGGADTLEGGDGDDFLEGGDGADILAGGLGINSLSGGTGDDSYYVESGADVITELAGQGNDTVFSSANAYTLSGNVETLSLDTASGAGVYGTGNAQANTIYGNVNDNILEGGGGADILNGLGGNDNFVFRPGDANGDVIHAFDGNGAAVGDFMYFIGYGTIAQGATFHQLTATTWEISSADGLTHDTITFAGGPAIDAGDFVFI